MYTSDKYSFRSYQRTILPPAPSRFNVVQESLRYEINNRPLNDPLLIDNTTVRARRILKRALVDDDFEPSSEGYEVIQLAKVMNVQQLIIARYLLLLNQTLAKGSSEMLQLSPLEVLELTILRKVDSVIRTQDHLIIGKDAYASLVVTS